MYPEEPESISPEDKKSGLYGVLIISILIILVLSAITYTIAKVYFPHAECKIYVDLWHKGEFWDVMDYVKIYDPLAYSLICNNVNEVEFTSYMKQNAVGQFEIKQVSGINFETKISFLKSFWSNYNNAPFTERASVFIHEVCHATMFKIRGNLFGMDGCDIEYPCYLRDALLKYKFGYYNNTGNPYNAMLNERKVCSTKQVGPNDYCSHASIKIKEASKGKIVIENNGTAQLHCMMLELSINGRLHPVDCDYLSPSNSVIIYNKYFDESSNTTLRIFGCKDRIRANVK